MGNIRSFKELRVWQGAVDLGMRVYELSKRFPAEEKYSMTDQFRRASRSVAANISEAWRKRRYEAAFISKLNDAEGEAAEAQTWVEFALRCGFMSNSDARELDRNYERILGQLVTMIENAGDWVVGANRRVPVSPRPRVKPNGAKRHQPSTARN